MTEPSSLENQKYLPSILSPAANIDTALISPVNEIHSKKSAVVDNYDVQLERAKFMNIMSGRKHVLNNNKWKELK